MQRADVKSFAEPAGVAAALCEALEALPDGVAVFDDQDRYIYWNARYAEFYPVGSKILRVGLPFIDFLRFSLKSGDTPSGLADQEAWIAARMARHRAPSSLHEHETADGRWMRIQERRTPSGGSVGIRTDITAIRDQAASFMLLFDANPLPMCIFAREGGGILAANDAALGLYGHDRAAFLALTVDDLHAAGAPPALDDLLGQTSETLWRQRTRDGREIVTLPYVKPLAFLGRPAALCCVVDITARNAIADELRQTRAFLHSVVEAFPAAVFVKDVQDDGRYVLMNRSGEALLGRDRADIIGRSDADLFSEPVSAALAASDAEAMREGLYEEVMHVPPRQGDDGAVLAISKLPIPSDGPAAPRFLLSIGRDITDERRMAERLTYLAHHDVLTGLPNRALFHDRLNAAIAGTAEGAIALLSIDLDGFKAVNDAFGHPVGDALLVEVGRRLRAVLPEGDTAARLGGDEFAVIHRLGPEGAGQDGMGSLADRIIATLVRPYDLGGGCVRVGATVGIAETREPGIDPGQLLRQADLALYHGKGADKGTVQRYRPGMDERCQSRLLLERDLVGALEAGEFELHYQPMVDLARNRICGFEALLRWNHPRRGTIPPSDFIPILEDSGAIVDVGAWVLRTACREAAAWPEDVKVAVNLSPVQFRQQGLLQVLVGALAASGLDAGRLELEITESVLLHDDDANLALLHQMRAMGVLVSLDDFGTGYSSLSYLRCFPFSKIKIDRCFVKGLGRDANSLAIVRAVSRLADDLGIVAIAEGIETLDQLRTVEQEGCREGQGYLFGRPLPACDAARLLGQRDAEGPSRAMRRQLARTLG